MVQEMRTLFHWLVKSQKSSFYLISFSCIINLIRRHCYVPHYYWLSIKVYLYHMCVEQKKKQRKLCPDKATSDFYWFTISSYGLISKCILYDNIVLDLMSLPSIKAKLLALNWCESESAKYINVYIVTSSTTNKF